MFVWNMLLYTSKILQQSLVYARRSRRGCKLRPWQRILKIRSSTTMLPYESTLQAGVSEAAVASAHVGVSLNDNERSPGLPKMFHLPVMSVKPEPWANTGPVTTPDCLAVLGDAAKRPSSMVNMKLMIILWGRSKVVARAVAFHGAGVITEVGQHLHFTQESIRRGETHIRRYRSYSFKHLFRLDPVPASAVDFVLLTVFDIFLDACFF